MAVVARGGGLVKWLAAASLVWPLLLGGAVWQRVHGGGVLWTTLVYAGASRVCHQRPERSFHTAGVEWPVCARCSGLYLSAPVGALAALWLLGRRRPAPRQIVWLAVAALPTVATVGLEWLGLAAPGNLARAVSALPLGATIAFVIVRTAAGEA